MKFVRVSSLVTGILMIVQWMFFLLTGNVPELETSAVEIVFHIVIELVTGIMLISVFFILPAGSKKSGIYSAYAQGMLGYTVVNSAGYFAQSGDFIFIFMFSILLAVSILNTILIIKRPGTDI